MPFDGIITDFEQDQEAALVSGANCVAPQRQSIPIHLRALDVARGAHAAYVAGQLSAQGPTPDCAYRDASDRPCAIGVALPDDLARRPAAIDTNVQGLIWAGIITTDDREALSELQDAHDAWCGSINHAEGEARFCRTLDAILARSEA